MVSLNKHEQDNEGKRYTPLESLLRPSLTTRAPSSTARIEDELCGLARQTHQPTSAPLKTILGEFDMSRLAGQATVSGHM